MKININQCNEGFLNNIFDNSLEVVLQDENSSWVLTEGKPSNILTVYGDNWSLDGEGDNSLTVFTVPEEGQWVLEPFEQGVDLSNTIEKQLSILNELYKTPHIHTSFTRDYRYIKNKRDLLLFLKQDLHHSNVFVFNLKLNKDFVHNIYQNLILKNVYLNDISSFVDDYNDIIFKTKYLFLDATEDTLFYRLTNNQRVFINSLNDIRLILPLQSFMNDRIHILSDTLEHLEIHDYKHDIHASIQEEPNNMFRDIIFTTKEEQLNILSDTWVKINGQLYIDFNHIDIVNKSVVPYNSLHTKSVCIYEPINKVLDNYGILFGEERETKKQIKSVFPKSSNNRFTLKEGDYVLELYDAFTRQGVKIILQVKKDLNVEININSLKKKNYVSVKDKNLLIYNTGRWLYKITDKIRTGHFKVEEFQVLYTGSSGSIQPFLADEYVHGCKSVIVMNDGVYYLQYIYEYESKINGEMIYHWKSYEGADFDDFLYHDGNIDYFNKHYTLFAGDNL